MMRHCNVLKIIRIFALAAVLCLGFFAAAVQAQTTRIDVLQVKGTINPVLVDYIKRGINHAEENNAVACIIQLDTPGGLDTSMREIIQQIQSSSVPVVVYVSPSGARAASAGVFITLSAHVAAMSTITAIGAAHPVAIDSSGQPSDLPSDLEEKIVNDAVAYIRTLAENHGRNADWAERAVRESVSITEREALELNVVDLIAPDLNSLISQLDGRQVTMLDGSTVTLQTTDIAVNINNMNLVEGFLYAIADPNVAYILLSIALLGITAEIFNPGLLFPGIIGGICGLLAFYALGMLPVNYAGVLLIVLAFGLFIAEVFTTTFGVLTAGGLISLVIGSLILFRGGSPLFRVDPAVIATIAILIGGFVIFSVFKVVQVHRRRASTGKEDLTGQPAVARSTLSPEGMVFFQGELWSAISDSGTIQPGDKVVVSGVEGLTLHVKKP